MKRTTPQQPQATKQPSPRSRRPSREDALKNSYLRTSSDRASAFTPAISSLNREPILTTANVEQEHRDRELDFLNPTEKPSTATTSNNNNNIKPTAHTRGGSDYEFDNQLLVSQARGTSPNPQSNVSSMGTTRPTRPTTRSLVSQQQQTHHQNAATIRELLNVDRVVVERPSLSERSSPEIPLQHPPSPPPLIKASNIRPRSQSLDSKGGVMTQGATSTTSVTNRIVVPPSQTITTAASATNSKRSASPQPMNSIRNFSSNTISTPDRYNQPSQAFRQPTSPLGTTTGTYPGQQKSNSVNLTASNTSFSDALNALKNVDLSQCSEDQAELVRKFLKNCEEQKSTKRDQTAIQPQQRSRHQKENSLDEVLVYTDFNEQTFVNRQRTASQDAGRSAPHQKMFESLVNESTDGRSSATLEKKSPSPKFMASQVVVDGSTLTPATLGPISNHVKSSAVPDLTKSKNILSPSSAFFTPPHVLNSDSPTNQTKNQDSDPTLD